MAFMSKDEVKQIREEIKKQLPDFKISVTVENYTGVRIALISGPVDFGVDYKQINHYHYERDFEDNQEAVRVWATIDKICNKVKSCYDMNAGDLYADYSDMTYFKSFSIGKWGKPYIVTEIKQKKPVKVINTSQKGEIYKGNGKTYKIVNEKVYNKDGKLLNDQQKAHVLKCISHNFLKRA